MKKALTGKLGVIKSDFILTKLGFAFREQPILDYGIDAIIETNKRDGSYLSGKLIAAQIKSGRSFFYRTHIVNNCVAYYGDLPHYRYWLNHSLPVILILYNPKTDYCIWQYVNENTAVLTENGWRILVPLDHKLEDSKEELYKIADNLTEYQRRWASLIVAKKWMKEAYEQGALILEVQEWVNKGSGRGEFILKTDDMDGSGEVLFTESFIGFGVRPYDQVIHDLFPWADIDIDVDFYEENAEYTDWRSSEKTSNRIYPYMNVAGEVDYYRLRLSLNSLGESFLSIVDFLENGKCYLIDKFFSDKN